MWVIDVNTYWQENIDLRHITRIVYIHITNIYIIYKYIHILYNIHVCILYLRKAIKDFFKI